MTIWLITGAEGLATVIRRNHTDIGAEGLGDFMSDWWNPANWIGHYGPIGRLIYDQMDARTQYMWDDFIRGVPIVGNVLRTQDAMNFYDDYFKNQPNAGGYGNIKYHNVNLGLGSAVRDSTRFVSNNIANFYDDDDYIRGMKRNKNNSKDVMFW